MFRVFAQEKQKSIYKNRNMTNYFLSLDLTFCFSLKDIQAIPGLSPLRRVAVCQSGDSFVLLFTLAESILFAATSHLLNLELSVFVCWHFSFWCLSLFIFDHFTAEYCRVCKNSHWLHFTSVCREIVSLTFPGHLSNVFPDFSRIWPKWLFLTRKHHLKFPGFPHLVETLRLTRTSTLRPSPSRDHIISSHVRSGWGEGPARRRRCDFIRPSRLRRARPKTVKKTISWRTSEREFNSNNNQDITDIAFSITMSVQFCTERN